MIAPRNAHHGNRGFTLIETMVAIGIMTMMALFGTTFTTSGFFYYKKAQRHLNFMRLQRELLACADDDISMVGTIHAQVNRAQFSCLMLGQNCDAKRGLTDEDALKNPFVLFRSVFDPTKNQFQLKPCAQNSLADSFQNPNRGINEDGELCTLGELNCNYRYAIGWQPICPTTAGIPCATRRIRIIGRLIDLIADTRTELLFNSRVFNFTLEKRTYIPGHLVLQQEMRGSSQFPLEATNCNSKAWNRRQFNKYLSDFGGRIGGVENKGSRILLAPGTYHCGFETIGHRSEATQSRLVIFDNASTMTPSAISPPLYSLSSFITNQTFLGYTDTSIMGSGIIEFWEPKYIELQQYVQTCHPFPGATMGYAFGYTPVLGDPVVFAQLDCESI